MDDITKREKWMDHINIIHGSHVHSKIKITVDAKRLNSHLRLKYDYKKNTVLNDLIMDDEYRKQRKKLEIFKCNMPMK